MIPWMRSRVSEVSALTDQSIAAEVGAVSAQAASEAARDDAIAVSNASVWVPETYAALDAVISPLTFRTYRDSTGGASAVDPSLDTVRWKVIEFDKLSGIALSKAVTAIDLHIDVSPNPSISIQKTTSWFSQVGPMPTIKILVLESDTLTVFDGDQPSCPIWMTFQIGSDKMVKSLDPKSVSMKNGVLAVVGAGSSGLTRVFFAQDTAHWATSSTSSGGYFLLGGISNPAFLK